VTILEEIRRKNVNGEKYSWFGKNRGGIALKKGLIGDWGGGIVQ